MTLFFKANIPYQYTFNKANSSGRKGKEWPANLLTNVLFRLYETEEEGGSKQYLHETPEIELIFRREKVT